MLPTNYNVKQLVEAIHENVGPADCSYDAALAEMLDFVDDISSETRAKDIAMLSDPDNRAEIEAALEELKQLYAEQA